MRNIIFLLFLSFSWMGCHSQKLAVKKNAESQKGVLVYYMHEPYFLPIIDTSIEKISKANLIGLKLDKIPLNDVYDSVSHKQNIVIYVQGQANKIDTVQSKVGLLLVKIETKPTTTVLPSDTAAFNFEYGSNKWALIRYEIRFDKELVSITPLLSSDLSAVNEKVKDLKPN